MGTIETFILFQNTAKQRFQNAYEYEFAGQVFTKNSLIFVVCPKHGKYKTVAHRYLKAKHGCKFCYRQSCLNKSIQKIDTKSFTVYEYLGMYWHGHPDYFNPKDINLHTNKTFGDLYQETLDRLNKIKSLGYNVVVKWEETTRPKLSSV